MCQDGESLPAARAEIGTGLCHVYLSLHTVHRPGLQLGVCMTNYEPYVHLHIHLCCQIFVYSHGAACFLETRVPDSKVFGVSLRNPKTH